MTGQKPDSGHAADTLTIPAAAARLGVQERTLRRWVASGRVESLADGSRRLIPVSALAGLVTESPTPDPDTPADTVRTAAPESDPADTPADIVRTSEADLLALRQALAAAEQRADPAERRIAGAHLAARMMALRLSEALAGRERERQRAEGLAEDLAALRQELREERERAAEREQQHVAAERELRVLLLRSSESLAAVVSSHQAPALEAPRRRAWWPFGRR